MHQRKTVQRIISYGVIGLSILLAFQLYGYAPWRIDPLAFLVYPLLFLVAPLVIGGVALKLQPAPTRWSVAIAWALLAIGLISLVLLHDWPAPNTPMWQEDSYQTLAVLELWYRWLCIPVFVGGLVVIRLSRYQQHR